jgi:CheY-like chemotaxis protein
MPQLNRVLLVDDDEDLRCTVAQLLADSGWEAEEAANGQTALERLADPSRPRFDVILLDVMMPVMSGWQFLEQRRANAAAATVPVVLMTASRSPDARAGDVAAHLRKPFQMDQLFAVLARFAAPTQ